MLGSDVRFRNIFIIPVATVVSACKAEVLAPVGDIAMRQRDLLVSSVVLMLLIIIPVMVMIVVFSRKIS